MARQSARRRLELLIEVGEEVHRGWALRLTGSFLLIDVGVELPRETQLVVHALPPGDRVIVEPFEATVVGVCQDVLVPADAEHRFLVLLEPNMSRVAVDALAAALPPDAPAPRLWSRRPPPTHDMELLDAALRVGVTG